MQIRDDTCPSVFFFNYFKNTQNELREVHKPIERQDCQIKNSPVAQLVRALH